MNTEERISELEIHLTHQEQEIDDLNQVIISQQKNIDNLEARLLRIESMVKDISVSNIKDPTEEPPPPHY